MRISILLPTILSLSLVKELRAQNITPENRLAVKRLVAQAEKSFSSKDYGTSVTLYQKVDSIAPDIPEVKCNIGICYLHSRHKSYALPYLEAAKDKGYSNNDLYFYLGQAYHYNLMFDKAISAFQEYIKRNESDTQSAPFSIADAKRRIEISGFAKEHVEDSLEVTIENMGPAINTMYDEYVPIISADEKTLYFTSRRPSEFNDELFSDGKHYEDIHVSKKNEKGEWEPATVVQYPLNASEHDACIGISSDGKTLYLFRSKKDDPSLGNIYASSYKDSKWSQPEKLGNNINTPKGWESSISVSGSNKRLYFSSNRPGGYGGFDIWYCDLGQDQKWGEPKNLGPEINTQYNEDCPYIHSDEHTLFFSSDGHNTMGGFDVFSSFYNTRENRWTRPKNIGYPINSVDDDMYFIYSRDGSKGHLSTSLRPDSKGGKDLYVINRPLHSLNILTLRGKLLNSDSNLPVDGKITVTDLETNKIVGVFKTIDKTGRYVIPLEKDKKYAIQFESDNMLFASENIDLNDPEAIFMEKKTLTLKPIKKGNSIVLNNVFFEYNNYDLKTESLPELDKLVEFLKHHPNIKIKINGHTDSIGESQFNLRLSKKRANEVRNYLLTKGIDKTRMAIEGLGESKPIASNATPEGRKMNRYTECQIFDLDTMNAGEKQVHAAVDTTSSLDILLEGVASEKKQGAELIPTASFAYNNGNNLNELSRKKLDEIVAVMKREPQIKLEIKPSVDGYGKELHNKSLYGLRAKTILDYFQTNGIGQDRFSVANFQPTPQNKHQKKSNLENRKVRFALLAY